MSNALLIALNDRFLPNMKIFLYSLIKSNPNFSSDILVLSDTTLSIDSFELLKKIYPKLKLITAKVDDYRDCKPTTRHWGYNLFYRFDVFELGHMEYDKIIMLDSDIIITKNIDQLLELKTEFAACEKFVSKEELELGDIRRRFNCGLMVFSKKILTIENKHNLIKLASSKCWSSDQPIFNKYFENKVEFLPQKFNVAVDLLTEELVKEGIIFHFVGEQKPYYTSIENGFDINIVKKIGFPLLSVLFFKLKILEREVEKLYV